MPAGKLFQELSTTHTRNSRTLSWKDNLQFDRKITSRSLTSYISRRTSTNCTYLWNDTCSSQKYPPVHGKLFPGSWGTRTKSYMQRDYVMSWNICVKLAAGTATGGKYEQLFSGSDEPVVVGYSWKWCVGGEPLHQPGVAWTISRANYTDTHTNNSYTLDRPFQRLRQTRRCVTRTITANY